MSKNKFTIKEKIEFESFIENHLYHILKCGNIEYEVSKVLSEDNEEVYSMWVDIDHTYITFDITYAENEKNIKKWREKQYDKLVAVLCHEAAHTPTSEPDDLLEFKSPRKLREFYFERLTERMGRLIYRLYTGYMARNNIDIKTGKQNERKKKP